MGGTDPAADLQALRALLTERLVIMEQVAAFKWNEGLPIENKDREAKILEETIARADAEGLEPELATRVMTAQIEAAKIVQHSLFQQWSAAGKGKHDEAPDLEAALRPNISRLSGELIATLVAARDHLDICLAQKILDPVPAELADVSQAWAVAIEGVFGARRPCH